MYKLCLVSDNEIEAFKATSDFIKQMARADMSVSDMYMVANRYEAIVDTLWNSGVEFSDDLIDAVMEWKERNRNAA